MNEHNLLIELLSYLQTALREERSYTFEELLELEWMPWDMDEDVIREAMSLRNEEEYLDE